jgi:hypothetical protein
LASNAELFAAIDERLRDWQQGDVLLGIDLPFLRMASYDRPITAESEQLAAARAEGGDILATIAIDVPGFAIISQTCDLIRPCEERAIVKLAALTPVSGRELKQASQGMWPRYAFIPGIAGKNLVADLDSVMTVEKALIAFAPSDALVRGCSTDTKCSSLALHSHVTTFGLRFPTNSSGR